MANKVGEIIDDIAFRLGDPGHNEIRRPVILRAMNRIYRRANERYKGLVTRETSFVFSSSDITNGVNYKDLPSDWIIPYRMTPKWHYRDKGVFLNDEDYTYTIDADGDTKQIFFAGVIASTITVRYYSIGWELKDLADVDLASSGEVNTPEWPEYLWDYLIKAACIELSPNYLQLKVDLAEIPGLRSALLRYTSNKQATDPDMVGPHRLNTTLTETQYQSS